MFNQTTEAYFWACIYMLGAEKPLRSVVKILNFMPGIEDLLFGGAASLISNGINYAFQKKTSDHNFKLAEQSADVQYQRQLDFWHQQNEYNSPRAQVNRRLAAGLSPVEGVDSGNASQLSTVPGNEVGKNGALQFQSSIDLLESMRTIQDIRNLGKTGNKIDAEVSNLVIEGVLLDLEKSLKRAGLSEMSEKLKGLRIANERESRANKYQYTDQYYKDLAQNLANSNWLQGQDIDLKSAEQAVAAFTKHLYQEYGITPDILSQLIGVGSNLVGDLLDFGLGFGKDYFFKKKFGKSEK